MGFTWLEKHISNITSYTEPILLDSLQNEPVDNLNKITEISLLFGNSACALLAGSRFANIINNKILKELDLNNDIVNIKENELKIKKEINNKLLNNINNKLIKNNDILDYLKVTDNDVVSKEINNKPKKLVLKKIV